MSPEIHLNAHDGLIHLHGCVTHPKGSPTGGSACFLDEHPKAEIDALRPAVITRLGELAQIEADRATAARAAGDEDSAAILEGFRATTLAVRDRMIAESGAI